ncbi:hypothetical protein Dxin01_00131 [Deinococcus xinjiangensis]|uniref:Uncharacterized protein n=1 Tax=Deinococcus xinjiangensis TaxID=457454 RepID=A0ABP9V7B4_9DEIO
MTHDHSIVTGNPSAISPSHLAHLSGGQDQDFVNYQVASQGQTDFTALQGGVEHPAPKREKKPERRPIDQTRTFFVTSGPDRGGIRQNWNRWRLVYIGAMGIRMDPVPSTLGEQVPNAVELIWSEIKSPNGSVIATDSVTLQGADAYNFLKTVGDANANLFDRPRRIQA